MTVTDYLPGDMDGLLDLEDPATLSDAARGAALSDLGARYADALARFKDAEAEAKRLEQIKAALENALFAEMETIGVSKFKLDGVGTIAQKRETFAKVIDADLAEAWLMAHGYADVIKVAINTGRLRSVVKECEGAGLETPAGVDYWIKESLSLRRG